MREWMWVRVQMWERMWVREQMRVWVWEQVRLWVRMQVWVRVWMWVRVWGAGSRWAGLRWAPFAGSATAPQLWLRLWALFPRHGETRDHRVGSLS